MADEERTPEEKAREARLILENQLEALDEGFERQIVRSREAQEEDRVRAKERAAGVFPDEVLGRIDEEVPEEIARLVTDRNRSIAEQLGSRAGEIAARDEEISRVKSDFDRLRDAADPDSAAGRARREQIELEVDRQLRSNLGAISGQANIRGIRQQGALINDALQGALQQRANLSRDLAIESAQAQERIAALGAEARGQALKGREDLIRLQRAEENQTRRQIEELQGAIRQDRTNRQLFNLQQRSSELFGRLGLEESLVQQGIAERAGIRAQELANIQTAEASRHQQESERIQEIEARKPPPSGGGGKSVLCVQYWKMGDLDDDILRGDFLHTLRSPDLTDEVRICYYKYSGFLSKYVLKGGLVYRLFRPFVVAWANEMAAREGVPHAKRNWLGWLMREVGAPIHHWAGKIMNKIFKYELEEVASDERVEKLFAEAQDLWIAAHKDAGYMLVGQEAE